MNHDLRLACLRGFAAAISLAALLTGVAAYAEPAQPQPRPAVCGATASSGDCEYY